MSTSGLEIELLPARHGDAILLEWPDPSSADRPTRRMLVDCGPAGAYPDIARRLAELDSRHIDRLVLTHVDSDHIEGMILAVNDAALALDIGEVWYNGYPQLASELGPTQGEILSALIDAQGLRWNDTFDRHAARASDDCDPLKAVELPGGAIITVLAPALSDLRVLHDNWVDVCREAELTLDSPEEALELLRGRRYLNPSSTYLSGESPNVEQLARDRSGTDRAVANRSSIVLLVEHGDRRVLLAGDSTPAALVTGVKRLLHERKVTQFELTDFKLPHHGSANNITPEILDLVPAERYWFSTDGSRFSHPDDEAVATVIRDGRPGAQLVFNYSNSATAKWEDEELFGEYGYTVRYPVSSAGGVRF
jgi:hypothetical protein